MSEERSGGVLRKTEMVERKIVDVKSSVRWLDARSMKEELIG